MLGSCTKKETSIFVDPLLRNASLFQIEIRQTDEEITKSRSKIPLRNSALAKQRMNLLLNTFCVLAAN